MSITELVECKSAYETAVESFESAADMLELPDFLRAVLRRPEQTVEARIAVRMDNGRIEDFPGWGVRHNASRGPVRGGTLLRPRITFDDVRALAMGTTWRYAALNIPFGGGMGGVAVNPRSLARGEVDRLMRGYAAQIAPVAGADPCGLAADACLHAACEGACDSVRAACEHLRIPVWNARAAVQGFGSLGSGVARRLAAAQANVIGASDTRGAIYNARGLNLEKLIAHKERSGSVVGFPGAEPITDYELAALPCDVLVSAARENAIHSRNAPAVRARLVAEAADRAVTRAADQILHDRGVLLIPDMLCNAGAALAACDERRTGAHDDEWWKEPDVRDRLERRMLQSFREILAISLERGVDMRRAANVLGIGRVAECIRTGKEPL